MPKPVTQIAAPPLNQRRRKVFLARGSAASLTLREHTCLDLTQGRLWITFEAPRSGLAPRNGDYFIPAGGMFELLAGETAVLEAVGDEPGAWFDLTPVAAMPWYALKRQTQTNLRRLVARHAWWWRPEGRIRGQTYMAVPSNF